MMQKISIVIFYQLVKKVSTEQKACEYWQVEVEWFHKINITYYFKKQNTKYRYE